MLVKGNDGVIRGHLNICRHRAHAVVNRLCGNSKVLVCPYHGWTYNLRGELVSGPRFNSVEGFDKSGNSLWSVDVVIDETTELVFLKLDLESAGNESVLQPWNRDCLAGLSHVKTFDLPDRNFNWKAIHLLQRASSQDRQQEQKEAGSETLQVGETSILIPESTLQTHLLLTFLPQSPERTNLRAHLFRDVQARASPTNEQLFALIETRLEQLAHDLEHEHARIRDSAIATLNLPSAWDVEAYIQALDNPTSKKAARVGQDEGSGQWAQDQECESAFRHTAG